MDKEYILNNVAELSAQQLAEAIQNGEVSLDELCKTGDLDATKRKAIKNIISVVENAVTQAWEAACSSNNEDSLRNFIQQYPSSTHVADAQELIAKIQRTSENAIYQHRRNLDSIRLNPNTFSPSEILSLINNGEISKDELIEKCEIPESAIDNLDKIDCLTLNLGQTPSSIPEGYTEVYFWGGPGSGKTCALGAVLQMADYKGYLEIAAGPGYGYATQLKNIFSHDDVANDYLPAPSPVETTQYLPFSLRLPGEKKNRNVSLIELSGEVVECFYWKNTGGRLPTQSHADTFNALTTFLASKNRKLHFFFIDAGRGNKSDQRGLKQKDYLSAAATYFENHQLFDRTTDAIYIVLTKSDLLVNEDGEHVPEKREEQIKYARQFLDEQGYGSFINALKHICERYNINGGKLTVEPFSLGKVYFQQICNFNGTSASRLVDILIERIPGTKKSILDYFNA